ncbi:hypothetical protein HNO88_004331 [Novosphingobium chloroacetimidivorans]|uniref:TadE-like domain-containing protein n=1 Tax=Novosphingobium chloroacetimidivorans TaxID=1428314 RepID=A0A7W7KEF1_9SPHN|nr:TadE/TadG family type IV pilus assembly protein [Novosphingobium chloroacetimidivorans]MBB4860985.1 hypothetical protein [Novosphingobium chloroacetimidivorans]
MEFAICLPFLLLVTLWCVELANFILVRQQISQLALQVADNASRIGTQNNVQTQIDERQINDLFTGANLQSGSLDISRHGRIILSSLEVQPDPPKGQYIHWQRCFGTLSYASTYGVTGDGEGNSSFKGMGPTGSKVTALPGVPAMFVEIAYTYQPIISHYIAPKEPIQEIATVLVRDNRDTSGPGVNPVSGVTASQCQTSA